MAKLTIYNNVFYIDDIKAFEISDVRSSNGTALEMLEALCEINDDKNTGFIASYFEDYFDFDTNEPLEDVDIDYDEIKEATQEWWKKYGSLVSQEQISCYNDILNQERIFERDRNDVFIYTYPTATATGIEPSTIVIGEVLEEGSTYEATIQLNELLYCIRIDILMCLRFKSCDKRFGYHREPDLFLDTNYPNEIMERFED